MGKVISIEEYRQPKNTNLSKEDIFNLFLIFKCNEETLPIFDSNVLMESLAKYKNMDRFSTLLSNLVITKSENGKDIIDLSVCLDKNIQNKTLIINPSKQSETMILASDEEFSQLKKSYDEKTLSSFGDLMFFLNMDLEYGINNWGLVAEDEYIKHPKYPGIVTGEFIGQEKTPEVMKKVKKRAIERLKILYK